MEDSTQGNDKVQGKCTEKYEKWTSEESNELLKLMVDAATCGWRDSNGLLSKITVEKHILPHLNQKLGIEKTYAQYKSRVKWFKKQYNKYSKLMRHNSGFGWDHVTKKFTASDEIWDDYFMSHPEDKSYRTDIFPDYEDLRIAVGSGTAVGTHSIALGDDTDARTFYTEERRVSDSLIDDFMYDPDTETFIVSDKQDFISSEVSPPIRKRSRTEFEAKSSSFEPKSTQSDIIDKLASTVGKITQAIESIDTREPHCWNIIKEIPNLDDDDHFKVLDLLNTKAKKSEFLSMTPVERSKWITFKLN
ncbi:Hypothetical predicted protein [Olea europaea subsp. europaea]|uniref:Myb/SANT-like domain-containing protein n=1 Tax=Olea europaea subsp. europaea TaxID=158383 RepID=A0A8S0PCG5_OLEEU|nr:Hypothetical predicted protein [Olea europaea subsp. europaea]